MDSNLRSFIKVIVWRVLAIGVTSTVTYCVTGHLETAIAIGGIDAVAKTAIHFLHERIWNKIKFGRENE